MECFYAKDSRIKIGVGFEKLADRTSVNIAATRERDVRMPGTQIYFKPDRDRRVGHAFVKLKKVRVTRTNANPNDFRRPLWRKCSDAKDWQNESVELNHAEFFAQS